MSSVATLLFVLHISAQGTPARASVLGGQAPAEDFFSGIVFSFAACDCRSSLTLRAAELKVQVF
jgi:hypothetical protein